MKISRAKRPRIRSKKKKIKHRIPAQMTLWETKKNYSSLLKQRIVSGTIFEDPEREVSTETKLPMLCGVGIYPLEPLDSQMTQGVNPTIKDWPSKGWEKVKNLLHGLELKQQDTWVYFHEFEKEYPAILAIPPSPKQK